MSANLTRSKNVIEAWLRVNDIRCDDGQLTWAHLTDLAESFATLLDTYERDRRPTLPGLEAPRHD